MAIRLIEMNRILKETGSIYLHCDNTMSHYLKILMDFNFLEKNNFRSNICWNLSNPYVGAFKWKANNWIYTQNINFYIMPKTSNVIFQ